MGHLSFRDLWGRERVARAIGFPNYLVGGAPLRLDGVPVENDVVRRKDFGPIGSKPKVTEKDASPGLIFSWVSDYIDVGGTLPNEKLRYSGLVPCASEKLRKVGLLDSGSDVNLDSLQQVSDHFQKISLLPVVQQPVPNRFGPIGGHLKVIERTNLNEGFERSVSPYPCAPFGYDSSSSGSSSSGSSCGTELSPEAGRMAAFESSSESGFKWSPVAQHGSHYKAGNDFNRSPVLDQDAHFKNDNDFNSSPRASQGYHFKNDNDFNGSPMAGQGYHFKNDNDFKGSPVAGQESHFKPINLVNCSYGEGATSRFTPVNNIQRPSVVGASSRFQSANNVQRSPVANATSRLSGNNVQHSPVEGSAFHFQSVNNVQRSPVANAASHFKSGNNVQRSPVANAASHFKSGNNVQRSPVAGAASHFTSGNNVQRSPVAGLSPNLMSNNNFNDAPLGGQIDSYSPNHQTIINVGEDNEPSKSSTVIDAREFVNRFGYNDAPVHPQLMFKSKKGKYFKKFDE